MSADATCIHGHLHSEHRRYVSTTGRPYCNACSLESQRLRRLAKTGGYVKDIGLSIRERILKHTDRSGDCWVWTRSRTTHGYARISIKGRYQMGHRLSYEEFVGPIPDGLYIDHLCRNRACVNPEHLEPVTFAENVRRGAARKEFCIRGHGAERRIAVGTQGHTICKPCAQIRRQARTAREREQRAAS